jgi:hypothetical protein
VAIAIVILFGVADRLLVLKWKKTALKRHI